ncbi:MAG: histone H1 [Microscillaceae bacterium]|nr:histone H1 [Microscillaceae bacterium]MDW8345366.1 histone H1 [Bacteroidia bacterium]MDW8460253.1 histone H1 [Cytophagales bacterium]
MESYEKLKNKILEIEQDVDKFFNKKNQAAGTRVRKAMQEVKELAQKLRKEVQEIKNAEEAKKEKKS